MVWASQLSLSITLDDEATFDNFIAPVGSVALQAVTTLRLAPGENPEPFVFLWGGREVGLSHLLQAACQQLGGPRDCQYLPLAELADFSPAALENLESMAMVCLDDLDRVVGRADWEEAIFFLFNAIRAAGNRLLVASHLPPREIPVRLPDLRSRLGWGPCFHISDLDDGQRVHLLCHRARKRGLELSVETGEYIVKRAPRRNRVLLECLDRLDRASLDAQRRLTIPFVRQIMGW